MDERNGSSGNDRDGADAVALELLVLDRLVYRNRSQHRSAKYFTLILEVRRACRTLSAPKLPDLLAQGLGLIASVPDSRNGRAREAWVRSAAARLSRMRVAAIACAYSLESIVKASKHLAHQVSNTYFMALSTVFLASLARLFACNLHLGGRLIQVQGALLRTLLAQPCTSECLSASDMAECRVPEDVTSFLSRLRGAGDANKAARVKTAQDRGGAAAAAAPTSGSRGSDRTAVSPAPGPATPKPASQARRDEEDGDEDEDDTGEHIGRAPPAAEVGAGAAGDSEVERAVAPAAEQNTQTSMKRLGRAAAAGVGASVLDERASGARGATGEGGNSSSGATDKKRVQPAHKKVVLASEFSDSSSEDEIDTEKHAAATAGSSSSSSSSSGRDREAPTPQPPADTATVSVAPSEQTPHYQPSLFFSSTPRRPQQPRPRQLDGDGASNTVAAVTASSPSASSGGSDTSDGIAAAAAASAAAAAVGGRRKPKHMGAVVAAVPGQAGRVGWIIDPTPSPKPTPAPAVDVPLSGRRRKSSGGKGGRGRGSGDRQPGAASAVAGARGEAANAPGDGLREDRAPPPVSATPPAAKPTGGGTGVAVDAGEADAAAAGATSGDGEGGGGGGGSVAAANDGAPAPPSAERSNGKKGRARPEDAKARRRLLSGTNTLGSGIPGGVGRQAREPKAAGAEERLGGGRVSSAARGKPIAAVSAEDVKNGGGGHAGAKRSPSREVSERSSSSVKRLKKAKKKQKAGGNEKEKKSGGGGGGGRNAIDDIFGSLP